MTLVHSAERQRRFEDAKIRIIELYKNFSLREVKEIIDEEYGFLGEEHVYKGWLKRWGVEKNLKPLDKLEIQQRCGNSLFATPYLRNAVSGLHRPISRKKQQFRLRACSVSQPLTDELQLKGKSATEGSCRRPDSGQAGSPYIHYCVLSDDGDHILCRLQNHYLWYFKAPQSRLGITYGHNTSLALVFDPINKFLDCVDVQLNGTYDYLRTAFSHDFEMFHNCHFQIVVQFVACFSKLKWTNYHREQHICMSHVIGTAIDTLGKMDELACILKLLHQYQKRHGSMLNLLFWVLRLTYEMAKVRLRQPTDWLACVSHLNLLNREFSQQAGEKAYEATSDIEGLKYLSYESVQSFASSAYRIGYLKLTQDEYDEAKWYLEKALEFTTFTQCRSLLKTRMWTSNCMGLLCKRTGQLKEAAKYYQQTLEFAYQSDILTSADSGRPLEWFAAIEEIYEQFENSKQLSDLRAKYFDLVLLKDAQSLTPDHSCSDQNTMLSAALEKERFF